MEMSHEVQIWPRMLKSLATPLNFTIINNSNQISFSILDTTTITITTLATSVTPSAAIVAAFN